MRRSQINLSDIGFELLPYWDNIRASDYGVIVMVMMTSARFFVFTGPYSLRWTILRRTILCLGTLYSIRGVSIICTVLPNPAKECVSSVFAGDRMSILMDAWYIALRWKLTCADVLYSGHSVDLTLCLLIWRNYSQLCPNPRFPYTEAFGKTVATLWCFMCYLLIIITHFHYTVDVWIGFWLTYFVWNFYHEAIKSSPFFETRFFNFLTWMEMETTDLYYWRMRVQKVREMDREIKEHYIYRQKDGELGDGHYTLLPQDAHS